MSDTLPAPEFDLKAARRAFVDKNSEALARCLASLSDAADHDLAERARLFLQSRPDVAAAGLSPPFRAAALEALVRATQSKPLPRPKHLQSADQDFIAQLSGSAEWSVDQVLTRLALENVPSRAGSAAVVGTMRDDGIYILEWVAHHRALGFEHLFVYTNDNADGSDRLLDCLAAAGVLTVIQNEVTGEVPPEGKAFGHALNLVPALWEFEWALFVDSDEFLVPASALGFHVSDVLGALAEADPAGRFGAVLYDWMWYVSETTFRRQPGMLCERFQYTRDHWLGKCFVRLRDVTSMRQQHCPDMASGKYLCDSVFEKVDTEHFWERGHAQYKGGQLNHYWPKSFEEYAIKKARGGALGGDDNPYDRPYTKFFEWNGAAEASRHHPMPRALLTAVHSEIRALRALPGVAEAVAEVERGFVERLSSIGSPEQLQALYLRNRVPPGDL